MFQRKINGVVVMSILRSLRFMSTSNTLSTKNPFIKEEVSDAPVLELIKSKAMNTETHMSIRKVRYGEYDFLECKEGYILCYIDAYATKQEPKSVFYGVFYGSTSTLNTSGRVKGVQSLPHAKETAALRAIEMFPKIEAKKLCICTNCARTIRMMGRLHIYYENGYRRTANNEELRTKDTYEALNTAIRLRNDIQFRFLYTSSDAVFMMTEPLKLAQAAWREHRTRNRFAA